MEISLTACVEPDAFRARLDAALPEGIDVIEVSDLAVAPAPRLEASLWQVVLPGVAADEAASAVQAFLAAAHAEVERLTSNGVRRLDTRAGVVSLELDRRAMADEQSGCAILRMVVRHLTPAVRPEDILVAFRHMSALEPASPAVVTRLAQGPLGIDTAAVEASAPGPDVLAHSASYSGSPAQAGPARARNPGGGAPARRTGRCTGTSIGNVPGCGGRHQGACRASERVRTASARRGAARRGRLRPGARRERSPECSRSSDRTESQQLMARPAKGRMLGRQHQQTRQVRRRTAEARPAEARQRQPGQGPAPACAPGGNPAGRPASRGAVGRRTVGRRTAGRRAAGPRAGGGSGDCARSGRAGCCQ